MGYVGNVSTDVQWELSQKRVVTTKSNAQDTLKRLENTFRPITVSEATAVGFAKQVYLASQESQIEQHVQFN
jgi:hypothetical protein